MLHFSTLEAPVLPDDPSTTGKFPVNHHRILHRDDRSNPAFRREPRKQTAIKARIETADGRSTDCMIRDVSATGARLGLIPSFALPATFKLIFGNNGKCFDVQLSWRKESYAGVRIGLKNTL